MTEYTLSDIERSLLAELEAGAQRAVQEAAAPFNSQSQGILTLIYRQQGCTGNWRLSDDKRALVKQEA